MNYANRAATLDALRRMMQQADAILANEVHTESADLERQSFAVECTVRIARPAAYTGQSSPNAVQITLTATATIPHIEETEN